MIDKKDFIPKDFGWSMEKSALFFLGKEVSIFVDTKTDSDHPDKQLFDVQIQTLKMIHEKWDELSKIIEQELLAYENISKEELHKIINSPRVWLEMNLKTNQPMENDRWSFVLGTTESEDFGWHVEFSGDLHEDTWAGG